MNDILNVMTWPRAERSKFNLGSENGLYALFLCNDATIKKIEPGDGGLIYIGKASGAKGLKGRCHFNGKTRNHSPRKSLAFLLQDELSLVPQLVRKPNSASTWTLDKESETRLSQWMVANLLLAVVRDEHPEPIEQRLIAKYSPALNLTGGSRTSVHQEIADGRKSMLARAVALAS